MACSRTSRVGSPGPKPHRKYELVQVANALTPGLRLAVRRAWKAGAFSQVDLSETFRVPLAVVGEIISRRTDV